MTSWNAVAAAGRSCSASPSTRRIASTRWTRRRLVTLDQDLLGTFPEGYRHLAYLQTQLGFAVKRDMPGLRGAEVERLYARGAAWLSGQPLDSPVSARTDGRPGPESTTADHIRPVMP